MTWKQIAKALPEFVAWVVQTQGPLPEGEVSEEEYNRLAKLYENRGETP